MTDQPEPYDFHDEAHRALLNDNLSKGWQAGLHALLAIHDTLAEIRDRLPERVEVKVAPFDPGVIAANLEALKHEVETPMRGHGECCEPAPAGERRVNVTITDVYAAPDDYGFLRINVGPETAVIDQNASNVTVTDVEPAPADVDPDEALARVIFGDAFGSHEGLRLAQLDVARAAREYLMDEDEDGIQIAHSVGYEAGLRKAEAALADMTRQRDEQTRDAIEWRNRHDALRKDVWVESGSRVAAVAAAAHGILRRDIERKGGAS